MVEDPIRVLVVDDTVIYRKIISQVLAELPGIEVVGRASNGELAMQQIRTLKPHLVTLDLEMPVLDGLEVLRRLRHDNCQVGVIMLSARTARSAQATVTALELGALDFVLKPSGTSLDDNISELRESLGTRVLSLGRVPAHSLQARRDQACCARRLDLKCQDRCTAVIAERFRSDSGAGRRQISTPHVVAIGVSTGGPQALQRLVPRLPGNLSVPVLIVQHMPPVFTRSLADDLNRRSAVEVCEGEDGQPILPGHVYIAPGGQQMKVHEGNGGPRIVITADPPENSCRPSVDYLFRSVRAQYGPHTLAVIMTGMGSDGAAECRQISLCGGTIFAQDEASCVVFGMPRQPVEEALAQFVGPPERLATEISQVVRRGEVACR